MAQALVDPESWERRTQTQNQSWRQQEGAGEGTRAAPWGSSGVRPEFSFAASVDAVWCVAKGQDAHAQAQPA